LEGHINISVMLGSGCPDGRCFPGLRAISLTRLLPLRVSPSLSQKYLPLPAAPCCCRLPHHAPHPAPRGSPIQRRAPSRVVPRPHPTSRPSVATPRSFPCRARSSLLCVPPLLCAMPRPPRVPRCCRRCRSILEGRGRCRRHGHHDMRPQQGDVAMKAHVAKVSDVLEVCCYFIWMLQK
jgi:hypothetical protein